MRLSQRRFVVVVVVAVDAMRSCCGDGCRYYITTCRSCRRFGVVAALPAAVAVAQIVVVWAGFSGFLYIGLTPSWASTVSV